MSIEVRDLRFGYGSGEVLRGVSFTAKSGELTSVLGPNGVGKSTLFRCLLGLLKGYGGSITVDGEDTRRLSAARLARRVAYIPQSHYPSFNYSVFNMVLMGTTSQISLLSSPGEAQRAAAQEALERVGVAHLRDKGYTHISGGERQLVLIARALVQNARVLVLDEPTANLDYGNQIRVMEQLRLLTGEGYTVIQSTHNPEQAFLFSHSVVAMKEGRVLAEGPPPGWSRRSSWPPSTGRRSASPASTATGSGSASPAAWRRTDIPAAFRRAARRPSCFVEAYLPLSEMEIINDRE